MRVAATDLGVCGTDPFAKVDNVWIFDPLGLVRDALDVQCKSEVAILISVGFDAVHDRQTDRPRFPSIRRPRMTCDSTRDVIENDDGRIGHVDGLDLSQCDHIGFFKYSVIFLARVSHCGMLTVDGGRRFR